MGFVTFDVDEVLPDEENLQSLGFWVSVVRGNHLDGNILRVFSSAPFLRDVYRQSAYVAFNHVRNVAVCRTLC